MKDIPEAPRGRPATRIDAPPAAFGLDALIALAVGAGLVACLYFARAVLIPMTLAILLSFLVAPLVKWLGRLKLGHVASVFAAVVISVSVIGVLGAVIAMQLTELAAGMPRYQATIERKMEAAHTLTVGKLDRFAKAAGQALQRATVEPSQPAPRHDASSADGRAPAAVPVEVREPVPTPLEVARRVLSPAISPLETAFIVFVVMVVILLQRDDLRDRAIRLFGSRDLHRTTMVMDEAARRLSRYFVSQLGLNAALGVAIGAGLFFIGVPSPILWGILAALLRLVPYVGIWIAGGLATALAAAVSPGWDMAVWCIALFVTVELLVGQVVEPLLYGRSTGLSPFSVVVAAIFWSWIWGPIGLILSTPLTLCLLVLGRHIRRLEFLDVMLGDQPALTPVENFYQRALAGDPDEAIAQAEALLRERSLSAYYDEVTIKGLQLAANDVVRGSVTTAQLARIESTTNDLVDGLDSYPDEPPPRAAAAQPHAELGPVAPSRDALPASMPAHRLFANHAARGDAEELPDNVSDTGDERDPQRIAERGAQNPPAAPRATSQRVLCIPGRGPLDPLATTIMLQLLGKHGFTARGLPHEAASRASIDQLDADDAGIVCVVYLQIDGIPSHLRYMVRRIRARLPNVSIIVGLWSAEDLEKWSVDLQNAMGADAYVTSLQEMLAVCHSRGDSTSDAPVAVASA
ncbi:AI-2E family transporter [Paraburkholderia phenoliruptrix]|uniref:AI-2E family transporter n=1 Tax=Paraburkholderia phenoliruptrix TaxID=252970 RepID=UPI001C4FA8FB|nr:AI-2E family transporter [Paraburkholderia phenoliruptrix]MBW0446332.1 AI-2E family transporter [Paraburkholderia phenoliruptrix]MBW9096755.1 AI-2E family transporter [Paraburkholderia phenoliruptrix]